MKSYKDIVLMFTLFISINLHIANLFYNLKVAKSFEIRFKNNY
jgi:hypothetical protein